MMSEPGAEEGFEITPDTIQWLEIFVLAGGRIMLSLKRGEDVTEQLEELLREYGVDCHREFKSPCG